METVLSICDWKRVQATIRIFSEIKEVKNLLNFNLLIIASDLFKQNIGSTLTELEKQ